MRPSIPMNHQKVAICIEPTNRTLHAYLPDCLGKIIFCLIVINWLGLAIQYIIHDTNKPGRFNARKTNFIISASRMGNLNDRLCKILKAEVFSYKNNQPKHKPTLNIFHSRSFVFFNSFLGASVSNFQ